MLNITGEVRKVLDDTYTDKGTGKPVNQAILVIEPEHQTQNYEVKLTSSQCSKGAKSNWLKLIGKKATIEVSLYVNYQYRFHRFTAVTGNPIATGGR